MKKTDIKGFASKYMVEGVSSKFFYRNFVPVLLVVFFAMTYISLRFDCVTAMESVASLRRTLEITRTETQRERSMYMSATCESSMQQMVDTLGLGLRVQERPPFTLKYDHETD